MKKQICLLLSFVIFLNMFFVVNAQEMNKNKDKAIVLTLFSDFLDTSIKKKAYIINDEVLMDVGTLADLTGYKCAYWKDSIIFERGYRKIYVKMDGSVHYSNTDVNLNLSKVIEKDGYVYIPLTAGLRMLNSLALINGNKVYINCNNISLMDHLEYWNMESMVLDYDRDLPINSVILTKLGIFIATIFDQGSEYLINTVCILGPNYDKYFNAALYYLTFEDENPSLSTLEKESNILDATMDFFGTEFNDIIIQELEGTPSIFLDDELVSSLKYLKSGDKLRKKTKSIMEGLIFLAELQMVGSPQINSLKTCIQRSDSSFQPNLGLSLFSGVNMVIKIAENKFINYIPLLKSYFEDSLETLGNDSVLAGFSIGNSLMKILFLDSFSQMDNYDILFCLGDMQAKAIKEYNLCRKRIINGSTDVNDYIYIYNAMHFFKHSNNAIYKLLTEIYDNKKNDEAVKSMLSYWKNRANNINRNIYIGNITLNECIRDAIPTTLTDIQGMTSSAQQISSETPMNIDENVKKDMERLISLFIIGMERNNDIYCYEGKIIDIPNDDFIQAFYVYTTEEYANEDGLAPKDTIEKVACDVFGVNLQNYKLIDPNMQIDGKYYVYTIGDWGMSQPYAEINNIIKVQDNKIRVTGNSGWKNENDDGKIEFDLSPFEAIFEENPNSLFYGYTLYEVSFGSDQLLKGNNTEDWKFSYIDLINKQDRNYEYMLAYINNDDIPELIVNYGDVASGEEIFTFNPCSGRKVDSIYIAYYGLSYIERGNILLEEGGRMDHFFDNIYTIRNNQFLELYEGRYSGDYENLDQNGRPIYHYIWNNKEVTQSSYNENKEFAFDKSKAIRPYEYIYNANEIIEIINSL